MGYKDETASAEAAARNCVEPKGLEIYFLALGFGPLAKNPVIMGGAGGLEL
jgi:hypothetical protein